MSTPVSCTNGPTHIKPLDPQQGGAGVIGAEVTALQGALGDEASERALVRGCCSGSS